MNISRQQLLIFAVGMILMFPFYVKAQHPRFVQAPAEIKLKFDDKQKQIVRDLATLQNDEWAGFYWAQEWLIDGSSFYWSPKSGFAVRRGNDFHKGIEQVNYGGVTFNGNLLSISPEYVEKTKHSHDISTSFLPIKWNQQHWLIPPDKMALFIYAVNSQDYDEIHRFFLKEKDENKPNEGLPDVPKEYRKYLTVKPFKAKVVGVKINDIAYVDYTLKLNVGRFEGVIEGMKFYLIKVKDVYVRVEVTDVCEHTSTVRAVSVGSSGGNDRDDDPKVGWVFSSRMPQGY